jgi:hypothetical protein
MKALVQNVCEGVVSLYASAFAISALVALSCGSMPGDAIESSRTSAALSASTEQQATGAGHILVDGIHRTFAFGAVRHADGLVTGEAQLFNHANGFESHAELICMTVIGNRARMGGIIKHSDVRECEDTNMFFSVEDNGEGPQRRTDRISFAGVCDTETREEAVLLVTTYCETGAAPYDVGMFPIEDGNIQVHE